MLLQVLALSILVTECYIARLEGETQRERAEELVNINHPYFLTQLEKEVRGISWL